MLLSAGFTSIDIRHRPTWRWFKKLKALGATEILIEAGAGTAAAYTDQAYAEAGATVVPDAASATGPADIVFKVQRPMLVLKRAM